MDNTIGVFIARLEEDIDSSLHALGERPKKDPFEHGLAVGQFQGLTQALELLKAVLSDEEEQSSRN